MNTLGNTILMTGGTSGIGFELAAQFLRLSNTVIITGRDQRRIEEAQRKLSGIHSFQSDVTDPKAIPLLFNAVVEKFLDLNVLINNAGIIARSICRSRETTSMTLIVRLRHILPARSVWLDNSCRTLKLKMPPPL